MKEDYLWDKTGEDFEIQKLENALQAFRYRESEPPALPAKIIPFKKEARRSFFRLAFAFAACAALVITALTVWFQLPNRKIEIARNSAQTIESQTIAPPTDEKISDEVSVAKQPDLTIKKAAIPKQSGERKIIEIHKIVRANARRNDFVAQDSEAKKSTVVLTEEEKYAYGQLMLALSITSSKLKLVTDKIENVEEKTIVGQDER